MGGAFRKILMEYWGGDDGSNRATHRKVPTKEEIAKQEEEQDERLFEALEKEVPKKIDEFKMLLDNIEGRLFFDNFKTDKYKEKYLKWREKFLNNLKNEFVKNKR